MSDARDQGAPVALDLELFRVLAGRRPVESELRGPSMGSAIPGGARIRITPVADSLRRGQVVAFVAASRVMVHRVAHLGQSEAAQPYLITHGDGNWMCDPPIELAAVAGIVEEFLVDGQWRRVGPACIAWPRRAVSLPSFVLLRAALERSPPLAARLARAMSRVRMGLRSLWMALVRPRRRP